MSDPSRYLCVIALLTFRFVQGQTGPALIEQQFKRADSALAMLLERPETRMKEIAPVEDLFKEVLAARPEFMTVLRTNSKGLIVNAVSRDDSALVNNTDVSSKEWYSVPQESKRPYYGPVLQENRRAFLFWSRPVLVRNSTGASRFGGVVAARISLPACLKLFASRFHGPFQILFKGKEFYHISWDEHASYEEYPVRVPGVSGFTVRFLSKKQAAETVAVRSDSSSEKQAAETGAARGDSTVAKQITEAALVRGDSTVAKQKTEAALTRGDSNAAKQKSVTGAARGESIAVIKTFAKKTPKTKIAEAGSMNPVQSVRNEMAAPAKPPRHGVSGKNTGLALAGSAIVAVFISGVIVSRRRKKKVPEEKKPADIGSPIDRAKELGDTIRLSLQSEVKEEIRTQEMEETVRADLMQELKKEVAENEADILRNNARAELKEDFRAELQKNEAKAIRATVEQELTAAWREEIREKYHEEIHQQEMENLKKIVQEKLIEKEMPLLVESYRKKLTEEIRQKITDTFSDQIEKSERQAVREEIAQKLRRTEYERITQEEKEKIRVLVREQIAEKEMEPIKALLREELTAQMKAKVEEEAGTTRDRLREEMRAKIQQDLMEKEYNALKSTLRDLLEKHVRKEIEAKELPAIRDGLLQRISKEERLRVNEQERPGIIEAERKRLQEQEAPGLREEIRAALRETELETMRATVKTEIYSETVKEIKAGLEEEYRGVVAKKLEEYREALEKQVRGEIRGRIKSEYQDLVEHIELLSRSLRSVEALDSLSQTVTLLLDEKKKYKYFNLNTAQTESLLEYLKRVQNRFNIFLDKVDEGIQKIVLKVNSVMNTLDNSE